MALALTLSAPIGIHAAARLRSAALRLALAVGTALAALAALILLAIAVEGFVSPDRVNSTPDYGTPAGYVAFGAVWGAIAWAGRATLKRFSS